MPDVCRRRSTRTNRLDFHQRRSGQRRPTSISSVNTSRGTDAAELPLFDPLIKAKELEIEVPPRKVAQPKNLAQ